MIPAVAVMVLTVPASGDPSDPKPVVAVFDISVDGFQLPRDSIRRLTRYLNVRLMMNGSFQTAPESQLKEAMAALKLESQKDCYDESCRIQLGLEAAANKNLNVTIWKVGSKCSIIGALYDLRAAASESATEVKDQECTEEGLKAGIERFAAQLGANGSAVLPPPPGEGAAVIFGGSRPPPPVKDKTGYLSIEGTPAGARVDISGPRAFGENGKAATSLPMAPTLAPVGKYSVLVSKPGYDDAKRTVTVSQDVTGTIKIDLIKSSGQVEISGTPEGAKSKLKCQKGFFQEFGLPGPFNPWVVTVPRGKCTLVVERDEGSAHRQTFEVAAGAIVRITLDDKIDTTSRKPHGMSEMKKGGLALTITGAAMVLVSLIPISLAQVQASEIQDAKDGGIAPAGWANMAPYGPQWWYREGASTIKSIGSMVSRQRTLAVDGWSIFGVGSVVAAIGAILLGVDHARHKKRNIAVSLSPSGSGAAAGVTVSF